MLSDFLSVAFGGWLKENSTVAGLSLLFSPKAVKKIYKSINSENQFPKP